MKHITIATLAALLPAVALASNAANESLTPQDFIPPRPRVQFFPPGIPDSLPKDFTVVRVRISGKVVPVFIKHGFPLPSYPPCWRITRPTETCIEDDTQPPRP